MFCQKRWKWEWGRKRKLGVTKEIEQNRSEDSIVLE
jgi:hypothetical protein